MKICEKIEKIEQSFNSGNNNFKKNDEMTPNLKTINLSNEFMGSSESVIYGNKKKYKNIFECIHKWKFIM